MFRMTTKNIGGVKSHSWNNFIIQVTEPKISTG